MEMYWHTNLLKKQKTIALFTIGAIVFFQSCSSSNSEKQIQGETFFDIPQYFSKEIERLTNENPLVTKEVHSNAESETKDLHIKDWGNELSPFLNIDLNKEVYQNIIVKDSTHDTVHYSFLDNDVDLKSVRLIYQEGEIALIEIETKTKNLLYESDEKLHYSKGKKYSIEKVQKVKVLGQNEYKIIGQIE